jgi:hypothetical protein
MRSRILGSGTYNMTRVTKTCDYWKRSRGWGASNCEGSIETDFEKAGCYDMSWIELAQSRIERWNFYESDEPSDLTTKVNFMIS